MRHDGDNIYWSNSLVDLILVLIACSYTYTAVGLYLRISRSMSHSQKLSKGDALAAARAESGASSAAAVAAASQITDAPTDAVVNGATATAPRLARLASAPRSANAWAESESTPLMAPSPLPASSDAAAAAGGPPDDVGGSGVPTLHQLRDPAVVAGLVEDIRTAAGLAAFRRSITAVMSRSLYTEASRRELRGALSVFIAVMLSSALLILVRAVLSLALSGTASVRPLGGSSGESSATTHAAPPAAHPPCAVGLVVPALRDVASRRAALVSCGRGEAGE